MSAVIPLAVSILGILGLVALKGWEHSSGRVLFPTVRSRADAMVLRAAAFVKTVPRRVHDILEYITHHGLYQISRTALLLLRVAERRLMRVVNMIKGKGVVTRKGTNSTFLRDVAEHKNGIRERRNENNHV